MSTAFQGHGTVRSLSLAVVTLAAGKDHSSQICMSMNYVVWRIRRRHGPCRSVREAERANGYEKNLLVAKGTRDQSCQLFENGSASDVGAGSGKGEGLVGI